MLNYDALKEAIQYAIERIPEQGPLEFFVHHNTIHHYQHLNFYDAVKKAAVDYGCNAFMPEEYYWHEYANRRINKSDLFTEINLFLNKHNIAIPDHIFYRLIIQKDTANHYLKTEECDEIRSHFKAQKKLFYHFAVQDDFGIDIDHFISPHVLKFLSAYFDFGAAHWSLDNKKDGLWSGFCNLYKQAQLFDSHFLKQLSREIKKVQSGNTSESILGLLQDLRISSIDLNEYIFLLTYRFKGWGGLIKSLSHHPEWIKVKEIESSFEEFIAILLLCELAAVKSISNELPKIPRYEYYYLHSEQFIHHFFHKLFKHPELHSEFTKALPYLDDFSRQELLHKAFERTFYNNFLNTYATQPPLQAQTKFLYQIICCLDEREESLRRYLEKDAVCETFGHAGHFGLNINFKGYFDKRQRALCPVVAKPEYLITESGTINNHLTLQSIFLWGELLWLSALSSKTILTGTIQSFIGCILNIIPFSLDIASPRLTSKVKHHVSQLVNDTVHTEFVYKKEEHQFGMDLKARINAAYNLLTLIGLTKNFSPFVIILGHGSSSLNNPHEAAYDCGACGGGRGGPNSRLMALILNEPAVREGLASQNIIIPANTYFIGAYHNTCSDDITYYEIPKQLKIKFHPIQKRILDATQLNAKERCRRFSAIPYNKAPVFYHRKVQERSIDLRQPRPEYGHSTNAICIIGPRSHSRNLFLDRRSFLISYDPHQDVDGLILDKHLNTAVPVCSGINLEYYFSYIDNETYGSGTKLAHNVTSLIGVMNGYMSDLQNGLTSQMIEIHQPIRLCLFVICTLNNLIKVLEKECIFRELVKNKWISLCVHNLEDNQVYTYESDKFIPFTSTYYPPSYFHQDEDVFTHDNNLSFGHICL